LKGNVVKNATELRKELSIVWEGLKTGTIDTKTAAEYSNIAGKMINSAKVQVEYYALSKETPNIPFLK
jgi:hypothetical protein